MLIQISLQLLGPIPASRLVQPKMQLLQSQRCGAEHQGYVISARCQRSVFTAILTPSSIPAMAALSHPVLLNLTQILQNPKKLAKSIMVENMSEPRIEEGGGDPMLNIGSSLVGRMRGLAGIQLEATPILLAPTPLARWCSSSYATGQPKSNVPA